MRDIVKAELPDVRVTISKEVANIGECSFCDVQVSWLWAVALWSKVRWLRHYRTGLAANSGIGRDATGTKTAHLTSLYALSLACGVLLLITRGSSRALQQTSTTVARMRLTPRNPPARERCNPQRYASILRLQDSRRLSSINSSVTA